MASANNMQATTEKKAINSINKMKYKMLNERFEALFAKHANLPHLTDDVLAIICDVLKFDPEMSTYDKAKVQQKCLEKGKSSYQIYTQKYYESNKDLLNTRRTQKRRDEAICKLEDTQ